MCNAKWSFARILVTAKHSYAAMVSMSTLLMNFWTNCANNHRVQQWFQNNTNAERQCSAIRRTELFHQSSQAITVFYHLYYPCCNSPTASGPTHWRCCMITDIPHSTRHSQHTDTHASGGIRTRNPSKREAANPRLRPRCHWHRLYYNT
jgi:hypothetical protein